MIEFIEYLIGSIKVNQYKDVRSMVLPDFMYTQLCCDLDKYNSTFQSFGGKDIVVMGVTIKFNNHNRIEIEL